MNEEDTRVEEIRQQWRTENKTERTIIIPMWAFLGLIQLTSYSISTSVIAGTAMKCGVADFKQFGEEVLEGAWEMENNLTNILERLQ